jgi:solute carrier family 35 (UDP-xylose/UDP-N-acetylglucosamine transporter), member B4
MGIIILSVALLFAGLLGLVQDWTFSQYGRPSQTLKSTKANNGRGTHSPRNNGFPRSRVEHNPEIPTWQESMFYLHFLAMPLFLFVWNDLVAQFRAVHSGPRIQIPPSLTGLYQSNPSLSYPLSHHTPNDTSTSTYLTIPTAYFPLLLNTLTQLFCASGVHRLTGKVSSLTVTLTLVVRKAVSLVISVLLFGGDGGGNIMMWAGAVLVLVGTVGYSVGGRKHLAINLDEAVGNGNERKEKAE